MYEPQNADMTEGTASLKFTSLFLMKREVAIAVPKTADILFVATALWGGNPAIKYAGSEISPPPPPIASIRPAKNNSGHTIKNVVAVNSMAAFVMPILILYILSLKRFNGSLIIDSSKQ